MARWCSRLLLLVAVVFSGNAATQSRLPEGPLVIRDFTRQFNPAGTFDLTGAGWPAMSGAWTVTGSNVTLQMPKGPDGCTGPGRYTFAVAGAQVSFTRESTLFAISKR